MNDTLEPTVERLRHTFQAVADQVVDAPPVFHAVPVAAGPREDQSAEVPVVDIQRTRRDQTGRRRWLIAAAAAVAAAVVVIAATVLVTGTGGHHVRIVPPAAPTSTATLPSQSLDSVMPPEAATPTTLETSALVAGIAFTRFTNAPGWGDTSILVYADGSLIRLPAADAPGGIALQRLSPDGVERVRSAFLPTGVFEPEQLGRGNSCECVLYVRDGDSLLSNRGPASDIPIDPEVDRQVESLVEFVTHLESSLPASGWEDREIRAYVPSRYRVCVWKEPENIQVDPYTRPVPDLPNVLAQLLPPPLVELLDAQGWVHKFWQDCADIPLADGRVVAEWLTSTGELHDSYSPWFQYRPWIGDPVSAQISIGFQPLMPDGEPARMPPG